VKTESDTVPFYPYFIVKDGWAALAFLFIYCALVFFAPNMLGHPDNYIPANPMSTPAHIVPEWYFWPFYAILRAFTFDFFFIPAKLMGVLAMFSAILVWFFLPWLDKSPVRSAIYRPLYKKFFIVLLVAMAALFYCGGAPAEEPYVIISQIASFYYFAHFLIILPIVSSIERPDPLPFSITEAVLGHDEKATLGPITSGAAH
jgi:ubiquinol-cytochrome c reductase cytochrome b subunit